jgi:mRNA-degrading endonuclease RelE of RelBE toxin-antitoxin system
MTGKINPPWRLEVHHLFEKELAKLPRSDRQQILAGLEKLQQTPFPLAKSLKGAPIGGCESAIGVFCYE